MDETERRSIALQEDRELAAVQMANVDAAGGAGIRRRASRRAASIRARFGRLFFVQAASAVFSRPASRPVGRPARIRRRLSAASAGGGSNSALSWLARRRRCHRSKRQVVGRRGRQAQRRGQGVDRRSVAISRAGARCRGCQQSNAGPRIRRAAQTCRHSSRACARKPCRTAGPAGDAEDQSVVPSCPDPGTTADGASHAGCIGAAWASGADHPACGLPASCRPNIMEARFGAACPRSKHAPTPFHHAYHQPARAPRPSGRRHEVKSPAMQNSPAAPRHLHRVYTTTPKKPNSALHQGRQGAPDQRFQVISYIGGEGHNLQTQRGAGAGATA